MVVSLEKETTTLSHTNPRVNFLVLFPLGPLSLDSKAVQIQNCQQSTDRIGSKRILFGLSIHKGGP